MMTKKPFALLFTLALLVGLTACQPKTAAPAEIRIGVIAPLSGSIPTVGQSTKEAAEMIADEINAQGGLEIGGQKYTLTLLIEDGQDNQEASVAAALKLINQENVVAIIGPQASRNAIPVSRVAERAMIPMISPWSTNPETTQGKQYVFRAAFIDPFQGQVMARFAFEQFQATKAAVLYDIASAYNKGIAEYFKQAFEDAGGEVVAFESYTTGETDFTPYLQRIMASGAEVLFLPNYENEVPAQAQQARQIGLDIPLLGSDAWGTIAEADRADLEGAFFSTHYAPDIAEEPARTFIAQYQALYGHTPDDVAALTYDAFGLLFQAIQSAGSIEPDAIRAGLASIESFNGVTGQMQFRGSGDPVKSAVILQVRDGAFTFFKFAAP